MKREILFRGQRNDKEWIYGFLITRKCESPVPESQENYTASYIFDYDFNGISETEVTPETVGQFTGLADKNRVNIFEGDVINNGMVSFVVVFERYMFFCNKLNHKDFGYSLISFKQSIKNYSIIGNIHDNPELLK